MRGVLPRGGDRKIGEAEHLEGEQHRSPMEGSYNLGGGGLWEC